MGYAGLGLFILGIIFLIVGPINKRKNNRCSAQTQGMLIDIKKRYNSNGDLPDMYVYSYSVDGTEYQTKSTIRGAEAHETGDNCTIWYNPRKPKEAQPFHYESAGAYRIIFIIGIAMFLLGILLIIFGLAH